MHNIFSDLWQFSQFRPEINLSTHQYLLAGETPVAIHSGTYAAAQANLPEIERLLDGRALKYIFVSHIGADECGGLSLLTARWPDAQVICSDHTCRQLPGFGIKASYRRTLPGERITDGDIDMTFVEYPADPHLLPGLLMYEAKRGIFFSSDLMLRAGDGAGQITHSTWKDEIQATNTRQVPNRSMVHQLRKDLRSLSPEFIAVGHGYCMKLD